MINEPTHILKILDNARWAPSGDNMQPWRFEIIDDVHFVVHGHDTREHCVYDLEGHASQLAIGALLESISIAAQKFSYQAEFKLRENYPVTTPTIDVLLTVNQHLTPDLLFEFLPLRSVQRRVLKTDPLTAPQKIELANAIGSNFTIKWIEESKQRWKAAFLMSRSGKLRLTLPEAYPTHSSVIEWGACFSDDKIPDQAVGLDILATKLMKWAMKSWQRVNFLNKYCFGTILPRIELDFLPGVCCAAHFALVANKEPASINDFIDAGRALQRFWLTCTKLGLQLQPEMTPLIFSHYNIRNISFTPDKKLISAANQISIRLSKLLETDSLDKVAFIGRVGNGKTASARSIRLSVASLLTNQTYLN